MNTVMVQKQTTKFFKISLILVYNNSSKKKSSVPEQVYHQVLLCLHISLLLHMPHETLLRAKLQVD